MRYKFKNNSNTLEFRKKNQFKSLHENELKLILLKYYIADFEMQKQNEKKNEK